MNGVGVGAGVVAVRLVAVREPVSTVIVPVRVVVGVVLGLLVALTKRVGVRLLKGVLL